MAQIRKPLHPGEVLLRDFLVPRGLSQNRLALAVGVPPRRVNEIVLGKRRISADTALRFASYFATPPQFWMELQNEHDLELARRAVQREAKQADSPAYTADHIDRYSRAATACAEPSPMYNSGRGRRSSCSPRRDHGRR